MGKPKLSKLQKNQESESSENNVCVLFMNYLIKKQRPKKKNPGIQKAKFAILISCRKENAESLNILNQKNKKNKKRHLSVFNFWIEKIIASGV